MQIAQFLEKLKNSPQSLSFQDTMAVIDTNFHFTPTAFHNGNSVNAAGQNNGSCKLFSFALAQQLTAEQTLACFGDYYREDVLKHPDGEDHQNIRNFMKFGWNGIKFQGHALSAK